MTRGVGAAAFPLAEAHFREHGEGSGQPNDEVCDNIDGVLDTLAVSNAGEVDQAGLSPAAAPCTPTLSA